MLGIDYRSDSEDESPRTPFTHQAEVVRTNSSTQGTTSKLNLPRPSNSTTTSSKGLSLPAPKTKKAGGPKKILVELPKLDKHASDDELSDEMPAAKRPRLGGEKKGGASSLLSMLPAPKETVLEPPKQERVLGGGRPGIVYSAGVSECAKVTEGSPVGKEDEDGIADGMPQSVADEEKSTSLMPPSLLLKGKLKTQPPSALHPSSTASSESATGVDFFSLGSTSSSRVSSAPSIPESSSSPSLSTTVSAAPEIEELLPPSPKIDDPCPGYYQLPSGAWVMHDPEYYKAYADRWQKEYDAQIRTIERGQKGFESAGVNGEDAAEVTAASLADAARAAREEKKALTQKAGREVDRPVPKVALNPTKMTGVARSRHQLHSLLADAFLNREALEEKLAQGRRNRKEAGNKYGF